MKNWEVDKVNELYRQLDLMSRENAELKRNDPGVDWGSLIDRIDGLETTIKQLIDSVEPVEPAKTTKRGKK